MFLMLVRIIMKNVLSHKNEVIVIFTQALIANGRGLDDRGYQKKDVPRPRLCAICKSGPSGNLDCYKRKTGNYPPNGYCNEISFAHLSKAQIQVAAEKIKPAFKKEFDAHTRLLKKNNQY